MTMGARFDAPSPVCLGGLFCAVFGYKSTGLYKWNRECNNYYCDEKKMPTEIGARGGSGYGVRHARTRYQPIARSAYRGAGELAS